MKLIQISESPEFMRSRFSKDNISALSLAVIVFVVAKVDINESLL